MNALEIDGLGHSFGARRVLEGVGLTVPAGRFVVLVGPNGAGKTTLFSLVTRLYHAREGTIRVFGDDLRREPLRALGAMGVVFQQTTLDLELTVAENLRYHAALHGLSRQLGVERAAASLGRLDIAPLAGRLVRTLSGGERRRVEIARALLHEPRLLLCDEPTAGLDPPTRTALIAHVRALCVERGLAVLWATHLLDEIAEGDIVLRLEHCALSATAA